MTTKLLRNDMKRSAFITLLDVNRLFFIIEPLYTSLFLEKRDAISVVHPKTVEYEIKIKDVTQNNENITLVLPIA